MVNGARGGLAGAVRFLTVLPAFERGRRSEERADPTLWFPVVGMVLGLLLFGLRLLLPAEGLLAAALVLVAWTTLTGGLHEDGWADCADAALAPMDRERRLQVLKDPRVGAHGLVALCLLLIVRLASIEEAPPWALLVAPVVGRWAMVLSLAFGRPLRATGLGADLAATARPAGASIMGVVLLAGALAVAVATEGRSISDDLSGTVVLALTVSLTAAAAIGLGLGTFLQRRFGGLSGDAHGAVGLAVETAVLGALGLWSTAFGPASPM